MQIKTHKFFSGSTPAQVAEDLTPLLAFQAEELDLADLETLVNQRLMPHLLRYDLPQFQSMFNGYPSPEAALGGQIMLETNQGVTNWQVSPGGAMLEEMCAQALCRLFGLGSDADATFMYSGTYANQQAVYLALHRFAERQGFSLAKKGVAGFTNPNRLAVIVSEDAHFSIKHAVRLLGLGEQSIIKVPVDENYRLDVDALQAVVNTIDRDIFCVFATTGTTSTGAVDPILPLVDICHELEAWLHVDGAYGYAYRLVPEWAHLFDGHDLADSICWDPHKQLGAPIPSSLLFVRDGADFDRMALHSDYFNRADDVEPNPGLKSPPSTRGMAVLPLVTTLLGQGLTRIVADLQIPLQAVRQLADYLQTQADFELCHQPDLGILCFRLIPPESNLPSTEQDALQRQLYDRTMASGERSISMTNLNGRIVLRVVSVSAHTKFADYLETIEALRRIGADLINSR